MVKTAKVKFKVTMVSIERVPLMENMKCVSLRVRKLRLTLKMQTVQTNRRRERPKTISCGHPIREQIKRKNERKNKLRPSRNNRRFY